VIEGNASLISRLTPKNYQARPSQVILFSVSAWDANCPQHIPLRLEAAEVAQLIATRDQRIAELEDQLAKFQTAAPR